MREIILVEAVESPTDAREAADKITVGRTHHIAGAHAKDIPGVVEKVKDPAALEPSGGALCERVAMK